MPQRPRQAGRPEELRAGSLRPSKVPTLCGVGVVLVLVKGVGQFREIILGTAVRTAVLLYGSSARCERKMRAFSVSGARRHDHEQNRTEHEEHTRVVALPWVTCDMRC